MAASTHQFGIGKSPPRAPRFIPLALCAVLVLAHAGRAQNGSGQPHPMLPQPIGQPVNGSLDDSPTRNPIEDEKLLRALNADRQKSLVSDTNKLLRLVNELNDDIARTNPDSLTPGQLRKLAEIEKLARSVREKMSTSVRGIAPYLPTFQVPHS